MNKWKQYKAEQRAKGQPAEYADFEAWLLAKQPKPKPKRKIIRRRKKVYVAPLEEDD